MSLETIVSSFGLPGIAVGVALEGEGVAFFGGVLAHRELFPVEAAAFVAALGAALSDNLSFFAGRFAGRASLVQRALAGGTAGRLRAAFDRNPVKFILSFRFLYGARVASAMLIGTTTVAWGRFLPLNCLSSLVWAHIYVWLGYFGSVAIRRAFGQLELHRHLLIGIAAAAVVGIATLLARRFLARRTLPPPEAGISAGETGQ